MCPVAFALSFLSPFHWFQFQWRRRSERSGSFNAAIIERFIHPIQFNIDFTKRKRNQFNWMEMNASCKRVISLIHFHSVALISFVYSHSIHQLSYRYINFNKDIITVLGCKRIYYCSPGVSYQNTYFVTT